MRRARSVFRKLLGDSIDWLLEQGDSESFTKLFDEVWTQLQWDRKPTARRLYQLARVGPGQGAIVEVGSYLGNSTIFLAHGSLSNGRERVHAVDPHTTESMLQTDGGDNVSALFLRNLDYFGVAPCVAYHRKASAETAAAWVDGPVRLLFIDGLHTYDSVLEDYESWRPHLSIDHVVVFDDFLWPEVERAVRDLKNTWNPAYFAVRGGQAIFATSPLPLRVAGLP